MKWWLKTQNQMASNKEAPQKMHTFQKMVDCKQRPHYNRRPDLKIRKYNMPTLLDLINYADDT